MSQILTFESVAKIYPARSRSLAPDLVAIGDLSFHVGEGEVVVLLGPSGCGKTTVVRLGAGFEAPTRGRIFFRDQLVTGPSRLRGVVFQQYSSFPWLSVLENAQFGLKYRPNVRDDGKKELAMHYLELVGLEGFAGRFPAELSGGMQQRLAIARTLAADPEILLMDEPFGSLDAQTREVLQMVLLQIHAKARKSTLFVTHDVEEAVFLADRIIVLSARPARIAMEVHVNLTKPRELHLKSQQSFLDLKRSLLERVREEARSQIQTAATPLPNHDKLRNEHKVSAKRHKN